MSGFDTQYEYCMLRIEGNFLAGLNQAGLDRWQAWALFGRGDGFIDVLFRRVKSSLVMANHIGGN